MCAFIIPSSTALGSQTWMKHQKLSDKVLTEGAAIKFNRNSSQVRTYCGIIRNWFGVEQRKLNKGVVKQVRLWTLIGSHFTCLSSADMGSWGVRADIDPGGVRLRSQHSFDIGTAVPVKSKPKWSALLCQSSYWTSADEPFKPQLLRGGAECST